MDTKRNLVDEIAATLEQNTRGVQIGIYTLAGLGLAVAIHKVRPISKFSRVADVPEHFIKLKEVQRGYVVGCEPSLAGPRILVDHRPPLRIPIWHSSKPPLPVQVWGVKLASGNGVSWMQCVAVGHEAIITPLGRGSDALLANVTLRIPITPALSSTLKDKDKKKQKKLPQFEEIELGERLVELGLGTVADEAAKPQEKSRQWWLQWIQERGSADSLQQAQGRAKARRAGLWQDTIPPSRIAVLRPYFKSLLPPFGASKKFMSPSVL